MAHMSPLQQAKWGKIDSLGWGLQLQKKRRVHCHVHTHLA
jgi:hypothetical protein